jgi:Transposase DDE domain group 1
MSFFLDAHSTPPSQIILDLDATDDPLHGHQEGRFFQGYYGNYCYLPLCVLRPSYPKERYEHYNRAGEWG